MAAPNVVACAADTWTKVADNVIAARVWIMSNAPSMYYHTYVAHGAAAPTDLSTAAIAPGGDRDNAQPSFEQDFGELSDLYVRPAGAAGSVRVDAGAGGGGFDATIATNTGNTATSAASIDGKTPAKGTAVMAGSTPVTIATDDTQISQLNKGQTGIVGVHGTSEVVDFSAGVATSSNPLTAGKTYRFLATEDCHFCMTTSGADDATTSDTPLGAWSPEPFKVPSGATSLYVSAILDVTGLAKGKLFIDELT